MSTLTHGMKIFILVSKTEQNVQWLVRNIDSPQNGIYRRKSSQSIFKSNLNFLGKEIKREEWLQKIHETDSLLQLQKVRKSTWCVKMDEFVIKCYSKLFDKLYFLFKSKWKTEFGRNIWIRTVESVTDFFENNYNSVVKVVPNNKSLMICLLKPFGSVQSQLRVRDISINRILSSDSSRMLAYQTIKRTHDLNPCFHTRQPLLRNRSRAVADKSRYSNYLHSLIDKYTIKEAKERLGNSENESINSARNRLLQKVIEATEASSVFIPPASHNFLKEVTKETDLLKESYDNSNSDLKKFRFFPKQFFKLPWIVNNEPPVVTDVVTCMSQNHKCSENMSLLSEMFNNRYKSVSERASPLHYLKLYSTIIRLHTELRNKCFSNTSRFYGTMKKNQPMFSIGTMKRTQSSNNDLDPQSQSLNADGNTSVNDLAVKKHTRPDERDILVKVVKKVKTKFSSKRIQPNVMIENDANDDVFLPLIKSLIFSRQILYEMKEIPFAARNLFSKESRRSMLNFKKDIQKSKKSVPTDAKSPAIKATLIARKPQTARVKVKEDTGVKDYENKEIIGPVLISENEHVPTVAKKLETKTDRTTEFINSVKKTEHLKNKDLDAQLSLKPLDKSGHYSNFKNSLTASKKTEPKPKHSLPVIDGPGSKFIFYNIREIEQKSSSAAEDNPMENKVESSSEQQNLNLMSNKQLYSHFVNNVASNTSQASSNLAIDYTLALAHKDASSTKPEHELKRPSNVWAAQKSNKEFRTERSPFPTSMFGDEVNVPSYKKTKPVTQQDAQFMDYFKNRFDKK